jgi:hypothetical protein
MVGGRSYRIMTYYPVHQATIHGENPEPGAAACGSDTLRLIHAIL